jgi:hypothetical protein
MEKFIVSSSHEVYKDSFENGETDFVNAYGLSSVIVAETWQEAVKEYFEKELYYTFDLESSDIDEEFNVLQYSVLVDEDNSQLSEYQLGLWRKDNIRGYANNITLKVELATNVVLK